MKKPGRNDECWCGSGKKYKKCHIDFDERIEDEPPPRTVPGRMRINAKPDVSTETLMRDGDRKPCDYCGTEGVQVNHAQWSTAVLTT